MNYFEALTSTSTRLYRCFLVTSPVPETCYRVSKQPGQEGPGMWYIWDGRNRAVQPP